MRSDEGVHFTSPSVAQSPVAGLKPNLSLQVLAAVMPEGSAKDRVRYRIHEPLSIHQANHSRRITVLDVGQ
jgi:hypothetical protein